MTAILLVQLSNVISMPVIVLQDEINQQVTMREKTSGTILSCIAITLGKALSDELPMTHLIHSVQNLQHRQHTFKK